ncbi:MAG TPA: glycosyltransferase [Terracidiphilus sp.]|nr:glycosyltransferase [Terracidiphilus sp.]
MNILVIHNDVPRPDRNGAEARLMDILTALRLLHHTVTLVTVNTCAEHKYAAALADCGIALYSGMADGSIFDEATGESEDAFGTLLKKHNFDLAILTLWFWSFLSGPEIYMDKLWSASPRTAIAVLTDDRHGLRQRQLANLTGSLIDLEYAKDVEERERSIYAKSDLVLTITEAEKAAVRSCAPHVPCFIIPFSAAIATPRASYETRSALCMLANFSNTGAQDAALWFSTGIAPIIKRELPDVTTIFAGWQSEKMTAITDVHARLLGPVSDLGGLLDSTRVFISPLRVGTGIATKNVTAMAHGVPVVTTSIGAQSLGVESDDAILVRDSPSEFATAVIRAYTDADLWRKLSANGREHIRREFGARPETALSAILEQLPFIQHDRRKHSPASSTRWIERLPISLQFTHQVKRSINLPRDAYLSAGFALLRKGRPESAAVQFRHAMSFMKFIPSSSDKLSRALTGLRQCYEELGDEELCSRYSTELQSDLELPTNEKVLAGPLSERSSVSGTHKPGSRTPNGTHAATGEMAKSSAPPTVSGDNPTGNIGSDIAHQNSARDRVSAQRMVSTILDRVGATGQFWKPSPPKLPEGAADYLTSSNAYLQSLIWDYAESASPAMKFTQWSRSFIHSDVPLHAFRGDCAYVWQRRDANLPVAHLLTAYYLLSCGAGNLLQSMEEDDYFGAYTILMGSGKVISRDLLDSISEISFLERSIGLLSGSISGVIDVGSGYGRLGYRLARACSTLNRILCVDAIPESTFLCDYYLRFRGVADRAHAIPFVNIERALDETRPALAVSIHCLEECSFASTSWWVQLLRRYSVRYIFVVVNPISIRGDELLSLEPDGSRRDFAAAIRDAGYRLLCRRPKYEDPEVQRFGVSPAYYSLFELSR